MINNVPTYVFITFFKISTWGVLINELYSIKVPIHYSILFEINILAVLCYSILPILY